MWVCWTIIFCNAGDNVLTAVTAKITGVQFGSCRLHLHRRETSWSSWQANRTARVLPGLIDTGKGKALRHDDVWRSGCTDPRFLDLGTSWRWVVSFKLRPLYTRGKRPRYPLDTMLGGPQCRSGRHEEDLNLYHSQYFNINDDKLDGPFGPHV
jgi:hypothetical protein